MYIIGLHAVSVILYLQKHHVNCYYNQRFGLPVIQIEWSPLLLIWYLYWEVEEYASFLYSTSWNIYSTIWNVHSTTWNVCSATWNKEVSCMLTILESSFWFFQLASIPYLYMCARCLRYVCMIFNRCTHDESAFVQMGEG